MDLSLSTDPSYDSSNEAQWETHYKAADDGKGLEVTLLSPR